LVEIRITDADTYPDTDWVDPDQYRDTGKMFV